MSQPERLREALDTLRTALRSDPSDRFWQGWDAALAAVDVALNPDPRRFPPQSGVPANPEAPDLRVYAEQPTTEETP